jgi:hypothetical protein
MNTKLSPFGLHSTSVRPEPVEGPHFFSSIAQKKGQGFDKLSPNGVMYKEFRA